jgi:hypothetical protein
MDGAQEAAEDVVHDQGEQKEAAPYEEAGTEYEVGSVHTLATSELQFRTAAPDLLTPFLTRGQIFGRRHDPNR